ncbi:hypothetical protein [Sporolituus thermophilus]|uniref:DUF3967 domain-containing protein n=1 Tax=Sporolituus thermophilus DSM 23256 TaxID=1123285 RepID=A0A1G7IPB2_9FIRM|nr:hypothetical protein [Sporolituus thermophilus]SDF14547.1 hypothetical protein SAMN05660235_00571 [Sporolituus thermophilus DSM 23256]
MGPKNIEYQNGMFILSNPDDVTELVLSLRNKPLDEYVTEPVEVTNAKSQSEMLEEITARLQTIEEKMQQMESSFAAILRQTLAENERKSEMLTKITARLQTIEEKLQQMENSFVAILLQALEEQENERVKIEVERQQELAERERRLLTEIGAMLEKKTVERQQLSWWQKLFEAK